MAKVLRALGAKSKVGGRYIHFDASAVPQPRMGGRYIHFDAA
ncbi:hypothetical protein [Streptomyces sp. NPDC059009]